MSRQCDSERNTCGVHRALAAKSPIIEAERKAMILRAVASKTAPCASAWP